MHNNTEEVLLSQLYDIYEPLPITWWQNPWTYASVGILILCIALGWWLYRRAHRPAKPLEYWEQALADLDLLEQNAPSYEPAELYLRITHIFKTYAQIRFEQPLVDKTDYEIAAKLLSLPAFFRSVDDTDPRLAALPTKIIALKSLFEQGPLIKFAKAGVSEQQRSTDILLVRQFIMLTYPVPDTKSKPAK